MKMKISLNVFAVLLAILFFANVSFAATEPTTPIQKNQISGEITRIDSKLGQLYIRPHAGASGPTNFRINENDTRVNDPLDKKFLSVKDLRPGQQITVEYYDNVSDPMALHIVATPTTDSLLQKASGDLEAIDTQAGTIVLDEVSRFDGTRDLSYFMFEPSHIVVMKSPSTEPVELVLNPGDLVTIEYKVRDGKREAHSITLDSDSSVTKTTTTTTVTTSR